MLLVAGVTQRQVLLMLRSDCFAAALVSGNFCQEMASLCAAQMPTRVNPLH